MSAIWYRLFFADGTAVDQPWSLRIDRSVSIVDFLDAVHAKESLRLAYCSASELHAYASKPAPGADESPLNREFDPANAARCQAALSTLAPSSRPMLVVDVLAPARPGHPKHQHQASINQSNPIHPISQSIIDSLALTAAFRSPIRIQPTHCHCSVFVPCVQQLQVRV